MTSEPLAPAPAPIRVPEPAPPTTLLPAGPETGTAVVLGPVMPRWDGGVFFGEIAEPLLASGHRVLVYDTLSLLEGGDDLAALADRWAGVITAAGPVDLLAGNALGGAIVQTLLTRAWTHRARVLLLSGPTVADAALDTELERIAAAAEHDGLPAALRLLDDVVRHPGRSPAAPATASRGDGAAGRRLATGLRLLHGADAGRAVRDFPGELLHVYGTRSRLVGRRHLVAAAHHQVVGIADAGMRPHADRPDATRRAVARFLATPRPPAPTGPASPRTLSKEDDS
ncbi:alpha/beta fold hydrolase [Streptomyces sp. NBC_01190]|uniref:alpha/beta fold hydrolase n=1 Tax=Streptomyces sp. NBC_01190 TaxID=2903767 RepID=UPI003864639B|nr:alpha/beta hydrolase [Streptomyces sp. NBC_01190]